MATPACYQQTLLQAPCRPVGSAAMIITDDVAALVAERAPAADEARRLDDEVVAAIAATGVNRLLMPATLGGRDAHPREAIDAVAKVAAADGSAGWCTAISAGCNL